MRDSGFKHYLLFIWNYLYREYDAIYKNCLLFIDGVYGIFFTPPIVVSIEESISYIVSNGCSVARYGDGEMKLIMGHDISFQKCHPVLRQRLARTLRCNDPNLIICIPNIFSSLDIYMEHNKSFWREYLSCSRRTWYRLLDMNQTYYDAFVSRCYLPYKDKSRVSELFQLWQKVWNDRSLLIVEGEKTRFGVGNDLFYNARSIQRILVPATNAYDCYDKILTEVKQYDKSLLILLAVGPTATILAVDLYREGYQAIDIGHLDIEYEWFLKQVDHKVPVEGKYVNEAGGFSGSEEIVDSEYQSQIVKIIE